MRGGRAEAHVPRSDVSFRLDQKTGNFKFAIDSRPMQWSVLTEGKQKNELAQKEFRFIKTIIIILRRAITLRPSPLYQIALQQKTGNFKVAMARPMQWSALPEEKQKNQLAA